LKEKEVWQIVVQLIAALRYLHVQKRVVHRDIAPSNIMIDQNYHIKLGSFLSFSKICE
jgi:NIMA (never in mitosis gene a)-related kinase 10